MTEINFNDLPYKKEGPRWYCESRKQWRPVYDINRIEELNRLEKQQLQKK